MHQNPVSASAAVAAEVRGIMAKRGVTQTQLAEALDLSQPAIARRLAGRVPLDITELHTLAHHHGVPVETLLAAGRAEPTEAAS